MDMKGHERLELAQPVIETYCRGAGSGRRRIRAAAGGPDGRKSPARVLVLSGQHGVCGDETLCVRRGGRARFETLDQWEDVGVFERHMRDYIRDECLECGDDVARVRLRRR